MATESCPDKNWYLDITPEVNEIVHIRVGTLIVEIQNVYDSDGIALGNSVHLTQNPCNNFLLSGTIIFSDLLNIHTLVIDDSDEYVIYIIYCIDLHVLLIIL